MVSMRYHNKVVADFEPLVKLLPPSAVASPLRSIRKSTHAVNSRCHGTREVVI
jgi:hypothetical protein